MNRKNKINVIIAIIVALAFLIPTSAVFANNEETLVQPVMSILPATQTVEKDDLFTVDVYIDPEDYQISGANVNKLSFDPAIIQATSPIAVTFTNFFAPPKMQGFGTVDNVAGTITGIYELTMPFVGVGTEGTWITIEFTAVGDGTSPITMDSVGLPDENGDKIEPITVNNGEVVVTVEEFYTLDISVEGNGTTNPVPGIYTYPGGTTVDLEAIPDLGWSFDHWVGDVEDPNSAITNITMNENKVVTAYFKEDHYILNVSIVGNGTVDVDPDKPYYLYGEEPQLTAINDTNWIFKGWSGDLTGSNNPETIIMNDDKDVTATFTGEGDTIAPVSNHSLDPPEPNGDNGWYVSCVNVTIVATDEGSGVEKTWYQVDGGYWKIYDGTFKVCKEGYHKIIYYSIDFARNKEDDKIAEFKIDTKPPVTTHEFDGDVGKEGWFVSNVTVTISADDAFSGVNHTRYKINADSSWTNYTDSFDVTENGEYILYYYSVDLTGNVEPTKNASFKIEHDILPPVTTHDFDGTMGDNGWYVSDVIVTLTAEDDSAGVDYTMYKLEDDVEWQNYTVPIHVTEDGDHTIEYYSVDKVGNREDDKSATFKIDQTVPTIELTWIKDDKKLVADVYDETSGVARVEFYVNNECIGEATESPYVLVVANPRRGDIGRAIVYDNAGNDKMSEEIDAVPQGTSQSQNTSPTSTPLSQILNLW